ncbi:MAG: SprT family zinc-dependent metalloprotease [Planctomycetota bacterium]
MSLRSNRSTIWSLTQNATVLNLHRGYAVAPAEVLDAFAIIVKEKGRDTEPVAGAREVVRDWPGLAPFLEEAMALQAGRRRAQARCEDGGGLTHCCGTPEQRAYLKALYHYFNHTRFGGGLPPDIPLRLSNRMTSALGHMLPGHLQDERRYVAEIALNVDLLLPGNGAERIDTLLHEMAHAADYLRNGERGHGASWREWARAVGCRPHREYHRPVMRRRRRRDVVSRVPPLPMALRRSPAA